MSETPPIPVAVVGVGPHGPPHQRLAATLPGWRCVGAYDPDRDRLDALCRELGVTPLDNLDRAIELAAAVVIAAPTVHHAELAERALAAGRHVLVEKPIATSVAEGERMVAAAARHGAVLGVGHVEFYNPAVQAVLAREPRPRYLDAQRLSPFTRRSLDIDVVLDLMVHDLQLAQALNAGAAIREIRAVGVPVLSPRVDLANVRLEFENGCVATLTSSRVSAERVRKLRLFEPDCYHSVDYSEQAVSAYRLVHGHDEPRIEPLAIEVAKGAPLAGAHRASHQACLVNAVIFGAGGAARAARAAALAVVEAIERAAAR